MDQPIKQWLTGRERGEDRNKKMRISSEQKGFLDEINIFHSFSRLLFSEKPHTCEGGAHLRISFWHFLMNLKNKIILAFIMLHFLKEIKRNTCRYHYQNLDDIIYGSWDIEQNILKLVILGHCLPFYHPKKPKNQNFEKWKSLLEISSFHKCVTKITIICGSWDTEWDR